MDVIDAVGRFGATARRTGTASLLLAIVVLGVIAPPAATANALDVPVLMYHRITAAPPHAALPHLWIPPSRFRAQLRALKDAGWRTITAEELGRALRDGRPVGRKRFVITIDDGARDGWRYAAPIMERLGMRATYCVVPGRAHMPWQLSSRHMRRLRAAGHEIANHSLRHVDLRGLSASALRRQVFDARDLIRDRVGHAPRSFCYPIGYHDSAARRAVREVGHRLAFTTASGSWHVSGQEMVSPRVRVNGSDTPQQVLARLRR
jgi:peptidoglycan/xylan/chitin deacetylase (PgdA/CDA1 family)